MRRVFMDSGGFYAFLVALDPAHQRARDLVGTAAREGWTLWTTNAVVYETHALLVNRTRAGRQVGLTFLDLVARDPVIVERVTAADERRALGILQAHSDKSYSYCDALSFVVMERLRISDVMAFDRHFREYGKFTVL